MINNLKDKKRLNAKSLTLHAKEGFTMIEMIVTMSLFSVIVSVSTGAFINAMRTQRISVSLIAAQSNASLMIEQMAREIRTGREFVSDSDGNYLQFTNAKDETVIYRKSNDVIEKVTDDVSGVVTASNISVVRLKFELKGANDPLRASQITIIMGFGSDQFASGKAVTNVQTTISSRRLDDI